jgi:hypothetical protein
MPGPKALGGDETADRLGEVRRPRGGAVLVVHHAQLGPGGEREERAREVPSLKRVQPGGAHEEVARLVGADGLLSGELAPSVDGARCRHRLLVQGTAPLAGEDVVGGDVQQGDAAVRGRARQDLGPRGIRPEGALGVALRPVHVGPGGGVDHEIGADGVEGGVHRGAVGDVQRRARQTAHLVRAEGGGKGPAELAGGSRHQDAHRSASGAVAGRLPTLKPCGRRSRTRLLPMVFSRCMRASRVMDGADELGEPFRRAPRFQCRPRFKYGSAGVAAQRSVSSDAALRAPQ